MDKRRTCQYCGIDLAPHRRRSARFCDERCARQGHLRDGPRCGLDGCDRAVSAKGLCAAHYRRQHVTGHTKPDIAIGRLKNGIELKNVGRTCRCDGCDRPAAVRLLCDAHYGRYLAGTLDTDSSPIRKFAPVGSGSITKDGYRVVYAVGHPNAWRSGQIGEHTLVMSAMQGRALYPDETVHHVNGIRHDNRPENLELKVGRHGKGQLVTDRICDAVATLERYAPHLLVGAGEESDGDGNTTREYGP